MSAEDPLCRLVEFSINQLRAYVKEGDTGCAKANALRKCHFTILNNLPMTCQAILDEARSYTSFEYLLFYERVRHNQTSPHFFLDGVPAAVTLFAGATSVSLPLTDIQKLKFKDVIADRGTTVTKLEAMKLENPRKVELTTRHTADLVEEVPGPARFLVARTRAILQGLRSTKRAEAFEQCANINCNRLFYKGEASETWATAGVSHTDDDDEQLSSDQYWIDVGCSFIDTVPDARRFCCRACRNQHASHMQQMMPIFGLELDADDYAKKNGRARVHESFKLCLKRNEVAARALRTMRSKSRPNIAVHPTEIEAKRQKYISAMNIDLGILYAASVISESRNLSDGKILPGQRLYWRDNSVYFAKALSMVIKAYNKMKRNEGIISSMSTMPKFLEHLQINAHKMF